MKNARVLITGGAGFIGANLARLLLAEGYHVTVFDDLSTGQEKHLCGLPLTFVRGNILHARSIERVARGHDAVVHLAAQTGVPASVSNPRRDCAVNVHGTLNVLEAARHSGVQRVVFASSNAPLGRQEPPAEEHKAALPVSPYGASKLAGEGYCLAYQGSWGLGTVVLRFANVYGPFSESKGSVIAGFFKDILAGREVTIEGNGLQTRDFIYVGDICAAILASLQKGEGGEVFQIASGVETSILELVTAIREVTGRALLASHRERRQGDVQRSYASIAKAQRLLDWKPRYDLHSGLEETWAWFRQEA